MKKIIMLKGLPGSGKSAWAKQMSRNNQQYLRVNKDELREMMGYTPHREDLVLKFRDSIIVHGLRAGKNVIVDDTNFHPKHETRLKQLATENQAEFEIKVFDTPLEQCIANDLKRTTSVGEKVIKKMWRDYVCKPVPRKSIDKNKKLAIICDLDGTLCLHNGRSPYDTEKCESDEINPAVEVVLNDWKLAPGKPGTILFVSGREDKYYDHSKRWLTRFGFGEYPLYMRKTDDKRKDYIVKEEIYKNLIEPEYSICYVLDDRNQVVDMWRRNGLACLQVNEGDF